MRSSSQKPHTFCRSAYSVLLVATIVMLCASGCAEKAAPTAKSPDLGRIPETVDQPETGTAPQEVISEIAPQPESAIDEDATEKMEAPSEPETVDKDETGEPAEAAEPTGEGMSPEDDAAAKFRAALNALDSSINSAKASHEVRKAEALGLVKGDSATALEQMKSDADKGEVPVELVLLVTTLIEKGRGGASLELALGRYTEARSAEEKDKVIREICSIACRSEGQVLVALGVLAAEELRTRGLTKMCDDVASGTIKVEAPLNACQLLKSGNAGAEINQALASYAEANTEEERKQAVGRILGAGKQAE